MIRSSKSKEASPHDHPLWTEGPSTRDMIEKMAFSTNFDCPTDMIFVTDQGQNNFVTDGAINLFLVSLYTQGPDIVLHSGTKLEDPAHGFIKKNRDSTAVKQVMGVRIDGAEGADGDVEIQPRFRPKGGKTPRFVYKQVGIESKFTSHLFRIRTHSFRLQIPGNTMKEIFIWKQTQGPEIRTFRDSVGITCGTQWKLVRTATNEVVALYMSDWSKSELSATGYMRFRRGTVDLGREFELLATMSVLAVLRNPRF